MMLVGLTGGIGSGKTTVAHMFVELGVPVFIADIEAKRLMNSSKVIKRKLIQLFGNKAYNFDDTLNRSYIASIIFNDKEILQKMNAIVHSKVGKRFKKWTLKQDAPYVISEVAILFENDSYKNYDSIVTVTASDDQRIQRVLKRDTTSEEKIKAIMRNQWPEEDKIKLSNFVIYNETLEDTRVQVQILHRKLLKKAHKH